MASLSTGAAALRTDEELIVASREDPQAFRELYDRWAESILEYFVRRVLDVEVAADLMAETFAAAFESRARFRDVGRPGGAWLYGIARRKLSHFYRHRRVELQAARRLGMERAEIDEESAAQIAALADLDERRALVQAGLASLSAAERKAVELRVVEELDYGEIAARLDISAAAARTRVHRGLARLGQLMEVQS
jgi:RNA polymerase sigma-70 factor (ECF subfamily)